MIFTHEPRGWVINMSELNLHIMTPLLRGDRLATSKTQFGISKNSEYLIILACSEPNRRIAELYDDLRRADFQGDKEAVAGASADVPSRSHGWSTAGPMGFSR
jgi:hypothetical protein